MSSSGIDLVLLAVGLVVLAADLVGVVHLCLLGALLRLEDMRARKYPQSYRLALYAVAHEYGRDAGTSTRGARNRRTERERTDLWKRVGAFVRTRREELGLSQGDIIRVLVYKDRLCDASHNRDHVTGSIM